MDMPELPLEGDAAEVQATEGETPEQPVESFEQQVNKLAKQMTQDSKGNWVLPEGEYSEELRYAVNVEKRRRDTESALGKAKQELKAKASLVEELVSKSSSTPPTLSLSKEEQDALDQLKFDDPESWRQKINELEKKAQEDRTNELTQLNDKASQQAEIERRAQVLAQFVEEHPDMVLNDEVIANDIPPRITKRLEAGEVSFEDFLEEVYNYLQAPKKIAAPKVETQPNLGKVGGSTSPTKQNLDMDIVASYANELY